MFTEQEYKENFCDKFLSLLNYKYSNISPRKRRAKFIEDYNDRYNVDTNCSSYNWTSTRKGNAKTAPKLETLLNICALLDCDIMYFLSDQEMPRKDIEYIASNVMGLQYNTVQKIAEYKPHLRKIIDILVSGLDDDELKRLLGNIYTYASDISVNLKIIDHKHKGSISLGEDFNLSTFRSILVGECHSLFDKVRQYIKPVSSVSKRTSEKDRKKILEHILKQDGYPFDKEI